jgi:type IV secretory pathway TrbF-like protein
MTEHMFQAMKKPLQKNPYNQASQQWNEQVQDMMQQWQKLFK